MKKIIALTLVLISVLSLIGCNIKSMNYIISNKPSIAGFVRKTSDNSILIENESGEYWVSLAVENKDSMTHFNIDDEVVVYFDGTFAESYPMQIHTVYAITLRTPVSQTDDSNTYVGDGSLAEPGEGEDGLPTPEL